MLRYLDPGFLDGIDLSSFPAGILPYSSYDGCFTIMKTPGHTMGSVSIYSSEEGILFSGDTLFALGVGRTDLGGDFSLLSQSLHRLMELDGRTIVLPGHGPSTSISRERESNPYL